MHEWALAESVVETVERELEKRQAAKLQSVEIVFGELQAIDQDVFYQGLKDLLADKNYEADQFHIRSEAAAFSCNNCGREWELADEDLGEDERESIHFVPESAHVFIHCPDCGSSDFSLLRGRGIYVKSIDILEESGTEEKE